MNKHGLIRVIIVDDDVDLRATVRDLVAETSKYEIVGEASDGLEAEELAVQQQPELVIMDINMPRVDGLSAAARIIQKMPGTSVLMLSACCDHYRKMESLLGSGACGYIQKPVSPKELLGILCQFAEHRELSRPRRKEVVAALEEVQPGHQDSGRLTLLEMRILAQLSEGKSNTDIAAALIKDPKTVKNYLAGIFRKLDAPNRTAAVITAVRLGLVRRPGTP